MDDRSVLIEMKKQHMLKLGLGDGYELPEWAEDMIDKSFQQPDFRAEVAAALPVTWYADRPVEFRLKLLVEQWRKLHAREQQVAAALNALRANLVKLPGENEYNAAIEDARDHVDATIAALNLPTAKEQLE